MHVLSEEAADAAAHRPADERAANPTHPTENVGAGRGPALLRVAVRIREPHDVGEVEHEREEHDGEEAGSAVRRH